jgi:hypothetical protein
MPTQHLMTREEFEHFVTGHRGTYGGNGPLPIYVTPPFDLVPCTCGDVNSHGWRFVERRAPATRDLDYEPVGEGA